MSGVRELTVAWLLRRKYVSASLGAGGRLVALSSLGHDLHPSCYVDRTARIDHGTVSVGAGSVLGANVRLAAWAPIRIGRNVLISDGVQLLTGDHDIRDPCFRGITEAITVGDNVWLAQGAVILCGVTIGEGAVVGAYAVVTESVPAREVVAGNPARRISSRPVFEPTFIPAKYKRSTGRSELTAKCTGLRTLGRSLKKLGLGVGRRSGESQCIE